MDSLARLLKESWTLVEERWKWFASYFSAKVFLVGPDLHTLLPPSFGALREQLRETIIAGVETVDDQERFAEYFRSLGRSHRKYGVQPEHYEMVGVALLDALRSCAGERWSIEYDQAWRDAYATAVEQMLAGAAADPDPPFWYAEVLTHERHGTDVAIFTCRPAQHPLLYRAGQYVSVEVPRFRPREWRNYSIANAPTRENILEFHVRSPGAGWVSGALVRRIRPGDVIRLAAPAGSMTLDRRSTRDVLCVAGGVGLAPIKALVEELTFYNRSRWVHLFITGQHPDDLYALDGLYRLAARHPWLSVVPLCGAGDSRIEGRVEIGDVLDHYGPWTAHDCFVSGSASLVRRVVGTLRAQDVPFDQIRHDAFGDLEF